MRFGSERARATVLLASRPQGFIFWLLGGGGVSAVAALCSCHGDPCSNFEGETCFGGGGVGGRTDAGKGVRVNSVDGYLGLGFRGRYVS